MKKKIIVTGASGQLGRQLSRSFSEQSEFEVLALSRDQFDICSEDQINEVIDSSIELVVNSAAYTAVDFAEQEVGSAFRVNSEAVGNLGAKCYDFGIPVIHFSTDYVFSGKSDSAYIESDECSPLNVYGQSKLEGEIRLLKNNPLSVVIRTSWLYDERGKNFFRTMLRLNEEGRDISVVNDQVSSPTYAGILADDVVRLVSKMMNSKESFQGLYHYSHQGECSWFDFAKEIFNQMNINIDLQKVDSSYFDTPATRPSYSKLRADKWNALKIQASIDWKQALQMCVRNYRKL